MAPRTVLAMTDLPFKGPYWERLEQIVAPDRIIAVAPDDAAGIALALQTAEIALLGSDLDQRHLDAPHLRWVHVNIAGLTNSALPGVFDRDLVVTGAAGRSAPALAEHAFMAMLVLCSNVLAFHAAQQRRQWGGIEGSAKLRALYGRTIGIIGMGATGLEVAARARAFGMTVLGYRRRDMPAPPGVARMFSADRGETIAPILDVADIVVLSINLSDATHHLIDAAALARMKTSAILINLARGGVVDEAALAEALHARRIGGAALDVFEVEPLPQDSPLWDAPNTLITPHFSAPLPDRLERTLDIIAENFRRWRNGEPMLNRLVPEDVYTKPRR
jgi:phosphoglycerate dehydrogenase-like enzyme